MNSGSTSSSSSSSSSNTSSVRNRKNKTLRIIGISFVFGFIVGQTVTNIVGNHQTVVPLLAVSNYVNDLPTILYDYGSDNDKHDNETTVLVAASGVRHDSSTRAGIAAALATSAATVLPTAPSPPPLPIFQKKEIVEFEKQDRVVIATKLHSISTFSLLEQELCLLHYAYNNRVLYDIVVFTTEEFPIEYITKIKAVVSPANITIVKDNRGLEVEVDALEPHRKAAILKRCNVTSAKEMNWYMYCYEEKSGMQRLAYTWQAEFRALHIWTHPAIAKYKYMMWLDTDGFCTHVWNRDPIAYMIKHELVMFFAHFPMGMSRGEEFEQRYKAAFGHNLCSVKLTKDGYLSANFGPCKKTRVNQIHGFMHITDLDFYRSEPVMKWNRILIGDEFLSRKFDDQIGVTVPAAILAPNRSREMEYAGIKLDVFHNYKLDGKYHVGGFLKWWHDYGQSNFSEAYGNCQVTIAGR